MTKREALAKVFAEDCLAHEPGLNGSLTWIGVYKKTMLVFWDKNKSVTYGAAHLFLDEEGWEIKPKENKDE